MKTTAAPTPRRRPVPGVVAAGGEEVGDGVVVAARAARGVRMGMAKALLPAPPMAEPRKCKPTTRVKATTLEGPAKAPARMTTSPHPRDVDEVVGAAEADDGSTLMVRPERTVRGLNRALPVEATTRTQARRRATKQLKMEATTPHGALGPDVAAGPVAVAAVEDSSPRTPAKRSPIVSPRVLDKAGR
jgi:hypothetical protein